MKTQHTQGPWRVDVQGSYGDQVFSENGMIVADCKWTEDVLEKRVANARLIAAAPELLAALERVTAVLNTASNMAYSASQREPVIVELQTSGGALIAARAALAKAKGV